MITTIATFILTILIHKLYIKVIRKGVPILSDPTQAVAAWFVCLLIALFISGMIFGGA